jgi:Tol biopolymer transport system component
MSEMATGTSSDAAAGVRADARFAWLTLFLAAWIIVGIGVLRYAFDNGQLTDVVVTPYHLPLYTGIVAIGVLCAVLVGRAIKDGRGWRRAFPRGYGVLGAGFLALLVWPIVEIGWREGIGLNGGGAEQFLAPSRALLFIGTTLVAVGPLRAAIGTKMSGLARWPAVLSAALLFLILSPLGFMPASTPWLEAPRNEPQSNVEIWVMNADGSHQTRLIESQDGYGFGNPVWSPDGAQIAYNRFKVPERAGVSVDDQAIWLASADGTNQRLLIEGTGWYWLPHWSPDGAWILFTIDAQRGPGSGAGVQAPDIGFGQPPAFGQPQAVAPNVDVWRIRADGSGEPERVTDDPAEDRAGEYSPDGSHLLFDSTREAGHVAIYVANADGSDAARATFMGDDWGASWSPDGTRFAFHANPSGGAPDIYITTFPISGMATRVTDDPAADSVPNWSPDGSRIAFISDRDGETDIWSVAVDGSDPQNLSSTRGAGEGFTSGGQEWGPDGRILYSRSQDAPPEASGLVRENLAITALLLGSLLFAILVLAVLRAGAPFGAVAVIASVGTAFNAFASGEWRFLLAAILGGLLVDVLIRLAPRHRKPAVAGAGSAATFVLGAGIAVMATTGMAWSPTLLLGVTIIAAALGWAISGLIAGPDFESRTAAIE